MTEQPLEPRDRDPWTDIANIILGLFGMARTTTQEDYVLMPPQEEA